MEIYVEGKSEKKFKPDLIRFDFMFNVKRKNYDECLNDGSKIVNDYFDFLLSNGFKKESIKTNSFNIHRDKIYNETSRKYDEGDYVYSFSCKLEFDYDLELMSKIMEETAKRREYPIYHIKFCLKDEKQAIDELMTLAYKNAEEQAKVIAVASGKTLKDCLKVGFEPFDDKNVLSKRYYDGVEKTSSRMSKSIQEIFVPNDIELSHSLYTIWLAE